MKALIDGSWAAGEAEAIGDLADRWSQQRIDPERFHEIRSEIAARAKNLARRLRGGPPRRQPSTSWRPEDDARRIS